MKRKTFPSFNQRFAKAQHISALVAADYCTRRQLLPFSSASYAKTDESLLRRVIHSPSVDGNIYICKICSSAFKKNKVPEISVANNLDLDEIPQALQDLSSLELIFLSRRIPFMKLVGLPRGRPSAIHGVVVNIPVNPEERVGILPRTPSPDILLPVKLKRKLQYRGHVPLQNINPHNIMEGLKTLVRINPLYADIVTNVHWAEESMQSNYEL
jgi:hypothetical protein